MPSATDERDERRGRTRTLIDTMLAERQGLLMLYEKVAGIAPYSGGQPDATTLPEFSQALVDYIASGHFGLYGRISEGTERRKGVLSTASELYSRIAQTTETAIAFNDAYERAGKQGLTDELSTWLSKLGEDLAVRIELEDRLIAQLLI